VDGFTTFEWFFYFSPFSGAQQKVFYSAYAKYVGEFSGAGATPVMEAAGLNGLRAGQRRKRYTNPVLDADFPDPTVLRLPDGSFVAFATEGGGANIQCATSPDLVTWTLQPDALPMLPSWACSDCHRSCAPDVHHRDSRFYMYFLAYENSTRRRNCIGVATSDSATGPYVATDQPIVCDGPGVTAMDPRVLEHEDGNAYLYYGSHRDPIMVSQLDATWTRLSRNSGIIPTIVPDTSSFGRVAEAPWVYRYRVGKLTMLYSGAQCCGPSAHYAVMVARATHPLGPWEKMGPSGDASVVLMSNGNRVTNPGHNAVVTDDAGTDWLLYHANEGPQCNQSYCPRKLYLDRLFYNRSANNSGPVSEDDWPWTDGPSYHPMDAPILSYSTESSLVP